MAGSGQIPAYAALVLCAASLGACGDFDSNAVVARVGTETVTRPLLTHWVGVLKGGSRTPTTVGDGDRALRKQALELLISSQWLIGETAERGIAVSRREVQLQVNHIEQMEFGGGRSELSEFLKSTGETVADIELQARDEIAIAKLRRMAIDGAPAVTARQIAAYYARHKQRFVVPERRKARFINRKSKSAAVKVKRETEAGKSLTPPARRAVGEVFTQAQVPPYPGNKYEAAIDASKPGAISGPYHIGNDYWLYQVVRIIPGRQRALSEVARSIRRHLTRQSRRQALSAFVRAWTAEWTAKTNCEPQYLVPKCRQYKGPTSEEHLFGE